MVSVALGACYKAYLCSNSQKKVSIYNAILLELDNVIMVLTQNSVLFIDIQ